MSLRPVRLFYPQRGSVRAVAPALEPVTAAELRTHLVETVEGLSDTAAEALISAAREEIEEVTGIAMITQEWRLALDAWPGNPEPWWSGTRQGAISELRGAPATLAIPVYPLQGIDAVTVFNEAGASSAVTVATVFDVDTYQRPGRLSLKAGQTWPIALRDTNAIQIEYTAGFGDAASDVPAPLKRAVLQMAAYLYEHRGDGCTPGNAFHASGAADMAKWYQVARI
ncbi:MAG: hypothetical protein COZ09_10125 [Comamonadaceae bacterium CG_4_10_14_3_um_filter_60_42]|nr:MAG: hypothetical protein COZ09_10125 [Comamonadaceae bacterium CG_4_10_14_3_um_filter_60_42]